MAIEATEANFSSAVVERSRKLPVVVDFWAPWCGPCRVLGPLLERAADARTGKVELVKIDTDANPELSRRFEIQGIPAVKAFRDGEVVDEFVGALPQAAVERFFDKLVPSEADALVAAGDEQSLRRALDLESGRSDAAVALARLLLNRGETEQLPALLENVVGDFTADGIAAQARLGSITDGDSRISQALDALRAGDPATALELLAGVLAETSDVDLREDIRKVMVGVFNELGADHELSRKYRRRLAAALY